MHMRSSKYTRLQDINADDSHVWQGRPIIVVTRVIDDIYSWRSVVSNVVCHSKYTNEDIKWHDE